MGVSSASEQDGLVCELTGNEVSFPRGYLGAGQGLSTDLASCSDRTHSYLLCPAGHDAIRRLLPTWPAATFVRLRDGGDSARAGHFATNLKGNGRVDHGRRGQMHGMGTGIQVLANI